MPAGVTYDRIASTTLGTAASSVTFSSIAGTYTDLELVIVGKSLSGFQNTNLQFNGDTGARYSRTIFFGNGTSALSNRETSQTSMNVGFFSTTGSLNTIKLMNYSNSTTYKTVLTRAGDAADSTSANVGLWQAVSNAAITSITIIGSGNYDVGSTFNLYGIAAA
jgi:hypothetical protein